MKNSRDQFATAEHFIVRATSLVCLASSAGALIIFAVKHFLAALH
jgi:hypothetical protein